MKKTRRLFYLVTGVSTVMGIVAACTFPEPKVIDDTDGGGTEAGGGDVDTTEAGEDGGGVGDATSEGVDFDAAPAFDASRSVAASDGRGTAGRA